MPRVPKYDIYVDGEATGLAVCCGAGSLRGFLFVSLALWEDCL